LGIRQQGFRKSFLAVLILVHSKVIFATEVADSFEYIRDQVFSDPYEELPVYKINKKNFGSSGDRSDNHVLQAGRRSLELEQNLFDFPNQQKLFQANGICFAGSWVIDQSSEFTGLFSEGTQVAVIARASVALDGTLQKHKRAFGMAIKLFPVNRSNAKQATTLQTQNLFVMHSLGGIRTKYVLDLSLDNSPSLGSLPPLRQLRTALRLRKDFELAERQISKEDGKGMVDVSFRPVSHLAEVLADGSLVKEQVSPTWVRLSVDEDLPRVDRNDFRDELRTDNYPESRLIWKIEVAYGDPSHKKQKKNADWKSIGKLVLHESVTSATCDQRLFFQHPRIK